MSDSLVPEYQKLVKIGQTDSTNAKVDILKECLAYPYFLKMVKFALAGDKRFHIKALPKYKPSLITGSVSDIFSFLSILSKQTGASDADKKKLAELASIDSGTYEVVKRIVNKDLKCGVSAKLVNKAKPGTVNTVPYMRCSTDKKIENITYEAIIQEKADGMFVNVMINKKGQIKIITRNGKIVHQLRNLKKVILRGRELPPEVSGKTVLTTHRGILNVGKLGKACLGMVYNGELLVMKNKKILPRTTGNGILNSCLHGTANQKDADCVVLRVWDCLPLKDFYEGYCGTVYNTRLFQTSQFVRNVNDKEFVDMIMTKRVNSYEKAHDFYAKIRAKKGEGAILKNLNTVWKDHTSTDQVKMKNVSEAELEIVGWEYGKEGSKYEMCMGAIKCRSAEGALEVSVGSGFSDDEREADWELAEGAIVTIEFESVIQDKRKKGKYSLFLPRFKEVREDRDAPDTIQDILKR